MSDAPIQQDLFGALKTALEKPTVTSDEKPVSKSSAGAKTQGRKSLLKKRAARLAVIQALYHAGFHGVFEDAQTMMTRILQQWEDSRADHDGLLPTDTMPDKALLMKILDGINVHRRAIDVAIDGIILPGWSRERTSNVLLATLQAVSAEWLISSRKIAVLVDEYTTIADTVLSEEELSYLHKAIHILCERLPRDQAA